MCTIRFQGFQSRSRWLSYTTSEFQLTSSCDNFADNCNFWNCTPWMLTQCMTLWNPSFHVLIYLFHALFWSYSLNFWHFLYKLDLIGVIRPIMNCCFRRLKCGARTCLLGSIFNSIKGAENYDFFLGSFGKFCIKGTNWF